MEELALAILVSFSLSALAHRIGSFKEAAETAALAKVLVQGQSSSAQEDWLASAADALARGDRRAAGESCERGLAALQSASEGREALGDSFLALSKIAFDSGRLDLCWTALAGAEASYLARGKDPEPGLALVLSRRGAVLLNRGAPTGKDPQAALEHLERAFGLFERCSERDEAEVLQVRQNMAVAYSELNDFAGARAMEEDVLQRAERLLPPEDPKFQRALFNLSITLLYQHEAGRARQLLERLVRIRERLLSDDHMDLLRARSALAGALVEVGDAAAARHLLNQVLAAYERVLPPDHEEFVLARANLASVTSALGDYQGAAVLAREALESYERGDPHDLRLQYARRNYASSLVKIGRVDEALELERAALASMGEVLATDDPRLLDAEGNLASMLAFGGQHEASLELTKAVLARQLQSLPSDHLAVQTSRINAANSAKELGRLEEARRLEEEALESFERNVPGDQPLYRSTLSRLAKTLALQGDDECLAACLWKLASSIRASLHEGLALSPRQASAFAQEIGEDLAVLLALHERVPERERFEQLTFEELEDLRAIATGETFSLLARRGDARLDELLAQVNAARASLGDLVARQADPLAEEAEQGERVAEAALARDAAEERLHEALAERGLALPRITRAGLAAALPLGVAAVGFRSWERVTRDEGSGEWRETPALLSHVLREDGTLARVDLGELAPILASITAWRNALGLSAQGRGLGLDSQGRTSSADEASIRAAGERLRAALLDPLLAACGEAHELWVCLETDLHTIPLAALPLEAGFVGDRYVIRTLPSFLAILRKRSASAGDQPHLLAFGGIDYEAEVGDAPAALADARTPVLPQLDGRASATRFPGLSGTLEEVTAIASLFRAISEQEPVVLSAAAASKGALFRLAPGATHLHLATHGYSALGTLAVRGVAAPPAFGSSATPRFAPLALCGLALAGANRGPDSVGRVPGILTAEELTALDLSRCELAVLSACDTNVGLQADGRGVQSLQAAVHAAGARTAITALWHVEDEWTRRLMVSFYENLWREHRPVAEALWQAMMELRAQGAGTRHWAGWVLSGLGR